MDGGLDIPHSDKRFAGFKKDEKQLDAEVHRNYVFGGHVASYMRVRLQEFSLFFRPVLLFCNFCRIEKSFDRTIRLQSNSKWADFTAYFPHS